MFDWEDEGDVHYPPHTPSHPHKLALPKLLDCMLGFNEIKTIWTPSMTPSYTGIQILALFNSIQSFKQSLKKYALLPILIVVADASSLISNVYLLPSFHNEGNQ